MSILRNLFERRVLTPQMFGIDVDFVGATGVIILFLELFQEWIDAVF